MKSKARTAKVTPSTLIPPVKSAARPIEVSAIDEGFLRHWGMTYYTTGLSYVNKNAEAIEPRDPRHRFNPARCFRTPAAYHYQDKSGAEISLNTGHNNLIIDVNGVAKKGDAYFFIKIARILDGRAVDIYDQLIIRVKFDMSIEYIHSYPPKDSLGSRSRIIGLDEKQSHLNIMSPLKAAPIHQASAIRAPSGIIATGASSATLGTSGGDDLAIGVMPSARSNPRERRDSITHAERLARQRGRDGGAMTVGGVVVWPAINPEAKIGR